MYCTECASGVVSAEQQESPLPVDILEEVMELKMKGVSLEDIISRLRPRTVPNGYPFHTWKQGRIHQCYDFDLCLDNFSP